ncbi:hypothetical protein [Bifidobacterium phasiani]|uniref:Uncharacterized protein n=1 Tax=Bifidobacterium phasiani TaxID=2834431 RepID=A0ABS6WAI4_9BIFI|nr:hypothetical protein [Bifidobacterium phasiani]MBW3083332.1 hypothetical protein [Bifidobacterium phasiani]
MLDVNLFSQMGLLVLGGPMLLFGLVSFGLAGITYGVRTLCAKPAWEGSAVRPLLFLGLLLVLVGGTITLPALPALFSLVF